MCHLEMMSQRLHTPTKDTTMVPKKGFGPPIGGRERDLEVDFGIGDKGTKVLFIFRLCASDVHVSEPLWFVRYVQTQAQLCYLSVSGFFLRKTSNHTK